MKQAKILLLASIAWLLASQLCFATPLNDNNYNEGVLVVKNKTIRGQLKLNSDLSLVQLKVGNKIHLFLPKDIDRVTIEGKVYGGYPLGEGFYLFEVILDGETSILLRENLKYSESDIDVLPPLYLAKGDKITPAYKGKQLLTVFEKDKKWMLQYIKNNNLDLSQKEDVLIVFEYYDDQKI
ncbi:MAG: hypothetical protein JXR03_08375 [Cyclobacteriaceae bacterium]